MPYAGTLYIGNQQTAAEASAAMGSEFPIVIVAAAAGGFVVLVLIALILTRRGGSRNYNNKMDRNVVAFENPMYDDPASAGADMGGGDSGLYDEPAFNAAAAGNDKDNPMYQSNENVADSEEDEQGGYLDVNPDDEEDESESEEEEEEEEEESEEEEEESEEEESEEDSEDDE